MLEVHHSEGARRALAILAGFLPEGRIGSVVAGEVLAGTGATLDLTNPADGRVFASFAEAGAPVVDAAMDAARKGQAAWWGMTAAARGRAMCCLLYTSPSPRDS